MRVSPVHRLRGALLLSLVLVTLTSACSCEDRAAPDGGIDAGVGAKGDGGGGLPLADSGLPDAARPDEDGGAPDGGAMSDAGSTSADGGPDDGGSFSWEDVFGDGGLPDELACLPGTAPDLTGGVSAILGALDLHTYTGRGENGVVCGDQTCASDVPCCVLCGYASCAEVGDGGVPTCPAFTQAFFCDGPEDCDDPAADTCCYSLSGTGCRAAADCEINLPSWPDGGITLPFFGDGGSPDAGSLDAGSLDAGSLDAGALDGGAIGDIPDAGPADAGLADAGPAEAGPPDGGALDAGAVDDGGVADLLGGLLDQGVPVCRTLFDCDLLSGQLCCTSERLVSVELGLCLPALVCLGGQTP